MYPNPIFSAASSLHTELEDLPSNVYTRTEVGTVLHFKMFTGCVKMRQIHAA